MIDLKSKANRNADRDEDTPHNNPLSSGTVNSIGVGGEFDWNVINEYDPMWPNEYDKVVKELRDLRDREQETEMRKRRRDSSRFEDTQVIRYFQFIYIWNRSIIHFNENIGWTITS